MAHVFLAEEKALGRRVVVKMLPHDFAGSVNLDRFSREIQLAAQLQHPCIVPVLNAGVADGVPYYTMPFVDGKSLRERLTQGGELSIPEALKALRDLASALAYAHEHGIVHRDIKPENILVSDGYALITDFGVAKALAAATNGAEQLTATGIAIGTPGYMSPEQAIGDPHIDHRSDIYAFGCVAFELLVGHAPFPGRTAQASAAAHMTETPDVVTKHRDSVPPALAALVARCLEKRPADRPQSARELTHELEAIATPGTGVLPARAARPSRVGWLVGAAVVVAVASVVAIVAGRGRANTSGAVSNAKRVVVRTFTNNSGDKSLDPIGPMAADWIARGLTETKSIDVAGTEAEVVPAADVARVSTPVALGQFAHARYVIAGSYFTQGDSIVVQADLTDADAGRRVLSIQPVSAASGAKQAVLEQLRQRVAAALVPFFDSSIVTASRVPPKYEAYQEFLIGNQLYTPNPKASIEHLRAAARLDSTFMYARLRLISQYQIALDNAPRDSLIAYIEAHRDWLSPYEAASFASRVAIARRDLEAAYLGFTEARRLAPNSTWAAYELSETAMLTGRSHEVVRLLEPLDPESGALRNSPNYYSFLCRAYHTLGKDKELRRCYERSVRQFPQSSAVDRVPGVLGDEAAVEKKLDSVVAVGVPSVNTIAALYELDVHGHSDAARRIARRALERVSQPVTGGAAPAASFAARGYLLQFLGEWRELARVADSAIALRAAIAPAYRAIAAAMLGDTADARRRLQALALDSTSTPLGTRTRANVLAALGDKDGAVRLLQRTSAATSFWEFHGDLTFKLLRGYPPFESLLRPRD